MTIKQIRDKNHGFITSPEEMVALIKTQPLTQMLVRCGGCRFVCSAQDVEHITDIINRDGQDYVRDVSFKA